VIRQNLGMTETNASVTTNIGEDFLHRPESCGPAAATAEVQIRDPDDGMTVLPVGAPGEIWAKGPMTAIGYWNRPQATAETFVDGWVRTGDLGRLDAEGFCYILDRAKDMLIRGGENISCAEVENVLYNHPAVAEAAVVGLPHRVLGEEPAAVVRLRPGMSAGEAELRAHVADQLAAFKAPVRILITSEPLPRNPTGKILKPEVRKLLAEAGAAA
jgi:long-chain acyl-CoA synthetase